MISEYRVSNLYRLRRDAEDFDPSVVVSFVNYPTDLEDFTPVLERYTWHKFFVFDQESVQPKSMEQVIRDYLAIVKDLQSAAAAHRLLIHCRAGVSRSTAAAYLAQTVMTPHLSPEENFETLLRVTNKPWPNRRIVMLAGEMLDMGEALVAPIDRYRERNPLRLYAYRRLNKRRGLVSPVPR